MFDSHPDGRIKERFLGISLFQRVGGPFFGVGSEVGFAAGIRLVVPETGARLRRPCLSPLGGVSFLATTLVGSIFKAASARE